MILIIEDDESIRNALRDILELEDYRVQVASNGKEGLEALASTSDPCLILLDFMMPVMNGLEFAQALKKDDLLAAIPIVVISAYDNRAKVIPSAGFIKKPIDLDLLLGFVRQYCTQVQNTEGR